MAWQVSAFRYGTRELTRGEAFVDDPRPDVPLRMDYFFWLLRGGGGQTILVDTGFERAVGERRGRTSLIEPLDALARVGVRPADVPLLVLTHLHYDHTGHVDAFPDAEVLVATRELAAPHGPIEPDEIDTVRRVRRLRTIDDETTDIAPGVVAHLVGGHSPGQLVLDVETAGGPVVLASDAIHYYEELEGSRFEIFEDMGAMVRGYELLRELAARPGAVLVAGHDPAVLDRFENDGVEVRCGG
jgi:glyoxylase-like metal-dependent hydrolase (beta-lactamase superfamily II)